MARGLGTFFCILVAVPLVLLWLRYGRARCTTQMDTPCTVRPCPKHNCSCPAQPLAKDAHHGWTLCSSECDGGIQFRTCIQGQMGCPQGCSRPCNTHKCGPRQHRTLFPPDIVWFLHSHEKRHPLLHVHKRVWAYDAVQTMVYFSSGAMDFALPTIRLEEPRRNWTVLDPRQGVFNYLIFQWLRSMFPHARGFVHTDDDTYPVLPRIREKLDQFMCKHGGEFPYVSVNGGGECRAHYKEQRAQVAKKCKRRQLFPQGNVMVFNQTLLQEMAQVANIDTCPPTAPGDQAIGMLWQCMGGLTEKDRRRYASWDFEFWNVFGEHHGHRDRNPFAESPFTIDTPIQDWLSKDVYHNIRSPEHLWRIDDLFRRAFFHANKSWP
jgi:hypothetical protein